MSIDNMIRFETVRKSFGNVHAVNDVSFEIRRGEFFSLLGPSGCGKTTLLRLINKLLPLTSGRIQVAGRDIADEEIGRAHV